MQELTNGQKLQQAYRTHLAQYGKYVQFAVTLTLKQSAIIKVKRFENYGDDYYTFRQTLDDEKIRNTIKFFTTNLTNKIYGNESKHKNKQHWAKPLVIAVVEGRNTNKRTHLHMAIGNIPEKYLEDIEIYINNAFERCDFANKQTCIKPISNSIGWLGYITKEIGYTNNDALDIVNSSIPQFIQQSICTESRL